MTRKTKILLLILATIVIGTSYHYSYLYLPVDFENPDVWVEKHNPTQAEYIHFVRTVEEAAAKDDIGGQTPQETLALWVEAVKAGDLEKASTYFLITERKSALEVMKESVKNGVMPDVIADIENGGVWDVGEYTGAHFDTSTVEEVKESGYPGFEFRFTRNDSNGVWKMKAID